MAKYVNFNGSGMKLPTGSEETSGFLSKIKSAGSNISTSTIIIMLVVVLFIGIAIYYYYHYVSPSMKPEYNPNHEHLASSSSNSGKSAELLLFYVDWCPHCKTAKPAWDEIKTQNLPPQKIRSRHKTYPQSVFLGWVWTSLLTVIAGRVPVPRQDFVL